MRNNCLAYPRLDQSGLTLLELLLVVTILSAVAWMSLGVVNNNADQVRFEDTKNRLQAIRRAIIGDTSRTLNGQPVISGYVADMGQAPAHLQALMQREYCAGNAAEDVDSDCGVNWKTQPPYEYDANYNLWHGWNGPYLPATETVDYSRFQDGWGNRNHTTNNFGWNYSVDAATGDLTIQSFGVDGESGGDNVYEIDYPPATTIPNIVDEEYRVLVTNSNGAGGVYVDFGKVAQCWKCSVAGATNRKACVDSEHAGTWVPVSAADEATCTLELGVWLPSDASSEDICVAIAYNSEETVEVHGSSAATYTWDGSRQLLLFKFEDNTYFNIGRMTYRVFLHQGTPTPSCDPESEFTAGMTTWKPFDVIPRTAIPHLQWDIR